MKRTRWTTRVVGGVLAVSSLHGAGCKQQLFVEPGDYHKALSGPLAQLETHPHSPIAPSLVPGGPPPATVLDPTRPAKPITLKEAIAVAAEQGNIGVQGGIQNAGVINEQPFQFTGRALAGTDTIRALVLDPAIVGADIERALSKFDARWISSMSWNKQDQAVLNLQQSFSNGDSASFSTTMAKPLPTGGVAGVTFNVNYQNLSTPPTNQQFVALSTSYTPRLQFIFEQPLLQNFGVEVNQLSNAHPGSLLIQGLRPSGGQTTEGILITRIRYDQQKADFDGRINQMLLSVETAYWNLYAAYYDLYAQEETLKQSFELLTIIRQRFEAGTLAKQEYTQVLAQYWQFRDAVLTSRNAVLERERQLRGLLGMNSFADGQRLVPTDEPTLAPYKPDFYEASNDALSYRPELILARHDLKFRQLDLVFQKNQRRPDLRSFMSYDINGLGARLDGPTNRTNPDGSITPVNALGSLGSNQFNSWQVGLRLDYALGQRDANAAVRQAQMNVVRSFFQLQDGERKVLETIVSQYRGLDFAHQSIELRRQRRLAVQETLKLNRELIAAGSWNVNTLFNLLQVQRDAATAIAAEFAAIAQYNTALAGLEFAKGTIQRYNNVQIGDGPLPAHVQKRAADHFRERAAALLLRERPADGFTDAAVPAANPLIQPFAQGWQPQANDAPGMTAPVVKDPPGGGPMKSPEQAPIPLPKAPAPRPAATGQTTGTVSPWPGTAASFPATGTDVNMTTNPAFTQQGVVEIPKRQPAGVPVSTQPK